MIVKIILLMSTSKLDRLCQTGIHQHHHILGIRSHLNLFPIFLLGICLYYGPCNLHYLMTSIGKIKIVSSLVLHQLIIARKTEPRNACGVCDLAFSASSDLDQHMKQNHVSWSCPTTARNGKAAFFFEMCRDGCEDQFHSCRCCNMSFCDDSADWKQRKQHFKEDHRFLKCDHDQFFEHAQFCHHLAGSHKVEIESLGMTDLCRQKEYASS